MKKHLPALLIGALLLALLATACAQATPEVIEKEVIVEKPVVETVVVEKEVIVEKPVIETVVVEKEVVVTAPPEPVTLTYFTFSAAPDHLEDLDEMIQIFEQAHPNINIKVETASWDDYFTKLQTLIAGGTAPDVFELNYENFVGFASKGVLLNLDPLAKADTAFDPRRLLSTGTRCIQLQRYAAWSPRDVLNGGSVLQQRPL